MRRPKIAMALSLVLSASAAGNALSDGAYVPLSAALPYNWTGIYWEPQLDLPQGTIVLMTSPALSSGIQTSLTDRARALQVAAHLV